MLQDEKNVCFVEDFVEKTKGGFRLLLQNQVRNKN